MRIRKAGAPQRYKFIKVLAQPEGDLHLEAATWEISTAMISNIRVFTASSDWDLYILQNGNGHAANDANIPEMQIMNAGKGDMDIFSQFAYHDEDESEKVHMYYVDNKGSDPIDIYIMGYELA